MSKEWYESIGKAKMVSAPQKYAWNCALYYLQFSQEELLEVKEYLDIPAMVKYQLSATPDFLHAHFFHEINECLEIDWDDVRKYEKSKGR